ncbi:MAG TPA: diacylglycerol kinase family protein [Vicinamibacteria bacterium]
MSCGCGTASRLSIRSFNFSRFDPRGLGPGECPLSARIFVVINPASGKGRGASLRDPVLEGLGPSAEVEHALSTAPGDEAVLARKALAAGFRTLVAVGGDGTWSNVGAAIVDSGVPAALGLVAGGTGCDLAKTLGVPARDVRAATRVILDGHTRIIDVGRIEGKVFLNVAGFGFDIAVIEDAKQVRWLGGDLLYLYSALRQLRRFPGFAVEVSANGSPNARREHLMLVVANARVFGGGFQIAPDADLEDGQLDAVGFLNMGLARRLSMMGRLLRGTHRGAPEVVAATAPSFRLRFDAPPAYETDGEWNQAASADIVVESVPRALRVLTPAPR